MAATVLAGTAGGDNEVDFTVPGSDSAEAVELLADRFPSFAGSSVDVVYTADDAAEVATRIDDLTSDIADVDHVVAAEAGPVSPDGRTGLVQVRFDEPTEQLPIATVERVMDLSGEAETDGLRIELGGYPIEAARRRRPAPRPWASSRPCSSC